MARRKDVVKHRYVVYAVADWLADQLQPGSIIIDRYYGKDHTWEFCDRNTGTIRFGFSAVHKERVADDDPVVYPKVEAPEGGE